MICRRKLHTFIINALTFSTMFLLLLAGCNKNTIIFEDGTTPNGSSGNEDPGNSTLVTFNASVEGRNLLRSMSPMNKGIQSRVYVFDSSAGTKGSPEASGLYITSSPGVLTGSDGYKMFLSNGTYNFYAVSDNFSTTPPDIHEWRIRTPLQRYRLSLVERHTTGC